jgi:hypothetical protein
VDNKPTIRELLDACRVDQHDPQRPELAAELAPLARELQTSPELLQAVEKSERFDRSVRAALDDVAVPAGLADRMLAGCEAAVVMPAAAMAANEIVASRSLSRRQWIALVSTAASLLIVLAGGYETWRWVMSPPRPLSNDELAAAATSWFDLSGPQTGWQSLDKAPLAQYPLSRGLKFGPTRWARLDETTVVYELTRPGRQRALLFVKVGQRPLPGITKTFPLQRLGSSGGLALGAWQRGSVVYVLSVIEGDQRIEDFVARQPEA